MTCSRFEDIIARALDTATDEEMTGIEAAIKAVGDGAQKTKALTSAGFAASKLIANARGFADANSRSILRSECPAGVASR